MGASAGLQPSNQTVTPGSEAVVEVRIRNTGVVVDQFDVDVVGAASEWATVTPPSLSLFPGAEGAVIVTFRPPAVAGGPSGAVPFGVRVRSKEDAAGSVVEEGTLDVAPFVALDVSLRPRTARGRRGATYEVAVDNRGTAPVTVGVSAADPDQNLAFGITPASAAVAPDSLALFEVKVRALKSFRKGSPQTRPFEVVVSDAPEGGQPVGVAQAMFVQEQTSPPWLRKAVMAAVLGLVLLALLWFGLLRPTIRSEARQAAKEEVAPPTIAPSSGKSSGGGSGSGAGASSGADAGTGGGVATGTLSGSSTTIDGRLFVTEKGTAAYEVPAGSTLQLTDIVLQNPAGETGSLQIRRGDTALLVTELGNFRDLDYHFVAPIVFSAGQKLVLSADCTSATCTPGAYFAGFLVKG
jgi:hypothetical protein